MIQILETILLSRSADASSVEWNHSQCMFYFLINVSLIFLLYNC